MILIVSGHDDLHAQCVLRELEAMGRAGVILDTASLGTGVLLSQHSGTASVVTCPDPGWSVASDDIETVWLRRPGRFGVDGVARDEYREFVVREWRDAFWGWLDGLRARFVNPLIAQERTTKPLQTKLANEVGLRTPATCMTNDPAEFAAFVDRFDGEVVHKTLTQSSSMLHYTKAWSADDDRHLAALTLAPTLVQERIVGPGDVRVTVMGGRVFAARIEVPADVVDSRLVVELPYVACHLPDEVKARLLQLMQRLGLTFGTIDLKETDSGELVFLEVNPQGQFAYIEIMTGMPLLASFARFLALGDEAA